MNGLTVRKVFALLGYGVYFRLMGAATGEILHDSHKDHAVHMEQLLDEKVSAFPIYAKIVTNGSGESAVPCICIFVSGK